MRRTKSATSASRWSAATGACRASLGSLPGAAAAAPGLVRARVSVLVLSLPSLIASVAGPILQPSGEPVEPRRCMCGPSFDKLRTEVSAQPQYLLQLRWRFRSPAAMRALSPMCRRRLRKPAHEPLPARPRPGLLRAQSRDRAGAGRRLRAGEPVAGALVAVRPRDRRACPDALERASAGGRRLAPACASRVLGALAMGFCASAGVHGRAHHRGHQHRPHLRLRVGLGRAWEIAAGRQRASRTPARRHRRLP